MKCTLDCQKAVAQLQANSTLRYTAGDSGGMKKIRRLEKVFRIRNTSDVAFRNITIFAAVVSGIFAYFLWSMAGADSLVILLPLLVAILLVPYVEIKRHINRTEKSQSNNLMRQTQAIVALYDTLDVTIPLPFMGGWAIYPDFAQILVTNILESHPKQILELGSGTSTLIACLALKKAGGGSILSIDHDNYYGNQTGEELDRRGLTNIATVIHCPLTEVRIDSHPYRWYDISHLGEIPDIDMLIIDGPPARSNPLARFPALPLLYKHLSKGAVIILDDCNRKGERKILEMWSDHFDDLDFQFIGTQDGTAIIKRKSSWSPDP
jgi:predicted O-methyltransferase YrrM